MTSNKRVVQAGTATGLLTAALLASGPVAQATPVNSTSYSDCANGYVCFYTGESGTGKKCQYSQSNPRANEICSWKLVNPKSIYNRNANKVTYYAEQNYKNKIGSTTPGNQGNLHCCYTVRSLKF